MSKLWAVICAWLLVTAASASDELMAEQHHWQPIGESTFSVLFWDIYQAQLYSPDGRYRGIRGPLKLSLTYLRPLSAGQIVDATRRQWQRLGYLDAQAIEWLKAIATVLPDIGDREQLSFELLADGRAVLRHNHNILHHFPSDKVNERFLAIWLSPVNGYPRLTRELTGHSRS